MIGEMLATVLVVLLAVYGCAHVIRRVCLWATRCPRCAWYCRVAVPHSRVALAPLLRCLQSQAVWEDPTGCRCTLVLLSEENKRRPETAALLREAPSVIPVTAGELHAMLLQLAAEEE